MFRLRYFIVFATIVLFFLTGCSSTSPSESMFEDNGNLKEQYADVMQIEWCEHNKEQDFAVSQCEDIWESE